jgi:hypothetical protein
LSAASDRQVRDLGRMGAKAIEQLPRPPHPAVRLNTLCPYFTMFPLEFPWRALEGAHRSARVLDPFCGRGTTNYAARLRGLSSVGIDSNPVAVAIANGKTYRVTAQEVVGRCREILSRQGSVDVPKGEFWRLAYHPTTLREIVQLRRHLLKERSTGVDRVLRTVLLGLLHGPLSKGQPSYLSNQMPRTYATKPAGAVRYWKQNSLEAPLVDILQLVRRRATYSLAWSPPRAPAKILLADSCTARLLAGGDKYDYVITSPPYFGMYTYYPDQWLRGWFLGGSENPSDSKVPQIGHGSRAEFANNLAIVWRRIAGVCRPGAKLVVRFGSLPSAPTNPADLLELSLWLSEASWRVTSVESAGNAKPGRRQSDQFMPLRAGESIEEIDLYAELTT